MERAGRIAIVEDDQSLRETLAAVLAHDGRDVHLFATAETFLSEVDALLPDLVILDVGLPGIDGVEACARLRSRGHDRSVLLLTARHEVHDRVRGLDAGADDYLVKPFALAELQARIRSMLRRTGRAATPVTLTLDDLEIAVEARTVRRSGREVTLTKLEFDLLHLLVANSPNVLTRDVLHERIWGFDGAYLSNSLEVAISQLRRKLGGGPRLVHTVRGVGYVARSG